MKIPMLKNLSLFYLFVIISVQIGYCKGPVSERDTSHYEWGELLTVREIQKAEVFKDFPFLEDTLISKIAFMDSLISRGDAINNGVELRIIPDTPKNVLPRLKKRTIIVITIGVEGPYMYNWTYSPAIDGDLSYFCLNGRVVLFTYQDRVTHKNIKIYPSTGGSTDIRLTRGGIDDSKCWIYEYDGKKLQLIEYFRG